LKSLTFGSNPADTEYMTVQQTFDSRAVARPVEAGNTASCAGCGEPVKFTAKVRHLQVIANVYVDGKWNRVEHFHEHCYENAGEPYGAAASPIPNARHREAS
jgi:Ser-tRNA(Ala) deacylase AlaX